MSSTLSAPHSDHGPVVSIRQQKERCREAELPGPCCRRRCRRLLLRLLKSLDFARAFPLAPPSTMLIGEYVRPEPPPPQELSTWGEAIIAAATGNVERMRVLLSGAEDDGCGINLRTFRTSRQDVTFIRRARNRTLTINLPAHEKKIASHTCTLPDDKKSSAHLCGPAHARSQHRRELHARRDRARA